MSEQNLDCTEPEIISWPFDGKTIFWLAPQNKYILAGVPASTVIQQIKEKEEIHTIIQLCTDEFNLSAEQAETFVNDIQQFLTESLKRELAENDLAENKSLVQPTLPGTASKKYYLIYGISFLVEYGTAGLELLIHPKFEHLEVPTVQEPRHHAQVLQSGDKYSLWVNGAFTGAWSWSDSHFLSGKISMQILQKIYNKEENDWMAVFHAAGISNRKNCLMFLGDSGNGKSTLSAILMANGLDVLADDFLPIEKSGLVCHFPAAISVKDKAYEILIPTFPQLMQAREINNNAAGKTFRYLSTDRKEPLCVPCKALIFVKYEKDAGFRFEEMPGEEAFAHLVPDSWISPTSKNTNRFVNWFTSLPYYRLTYSDNEQMIQTVKRMLNDDL